jgi:hypothetical protein
MIISIENFCECDKNNLDPEIIKRFKNMSSREFVDYLINDGNHQKEITYFLTKSMHPDYVNQVLNRVTEELWFNQSRLGEIRKGPLKIFYSS